MNYFAELGKIGQFRYGGVLQEEFLPQLRGRRGVELYKEMSENDDIIGAILFAVEMLIRQVKWDIAPSGNSDADKKAAEFVLSCINDMDHTWSEFISEVLSFLVFGWSYHEIVYKRRNGAKANGRSKYTDRLIGWRKLPPRSQDTLWEWAYDDKDNLVGMIQSAPPTYRQVLIPLEKALHFRPKSKKGNPEGHSILRNAFTGWYKKRRIQELEGIGIERDLAGFPVLYGPAQLWDTEDPTMIDAKAEADFIVQNIRRDKLEGICLPEGWRLELLSTGGRRQFDTNTIIQRYNNCIAMTVLCDFITLGHEGVGSFALSSDKTKLFSVALGSFLDSICETFNSQAIPRLIDINGDVFRGITDYPELIHGDIESPDLEALGTFVKDMIAVGAMTPDEGLEDYLRAASNLPERMPESGYMRAPQDSEEE